MIYGFGKYLLDTDRRSLMLADQDILVQPQVFDVLQYLVLNHDRMVSKDELFDNIWKTRHITESALSSRIKLARQAVGDNGKDQRIIQTLHGRGYRVVVDVVEHSPNSGPTEQNHTTVYTHSTASPVASGYKSIVGVTIKNKTENQAEPLTETVTLIKNCIDQGDAEFVTSYGDTWVAIFKSTQKAVELGASLLDGLSTQERPHALAPSLCVAVHRGTIDYSDGKCFGNGINQTNVLLSITNPNQILVSSAAYQHLDPSHTNLKFVPAGAFNIDSLGDHTLLYFLATKCADSTTGPAHVKQGSKTNLPRHQRKLHGRSTDLKLVVEKAALHQIVSIVGPGGVGKTALAIAFGQRQIANYPGGVWLCELARKGNDHLLSSVVGAIVNSAGTDLVSIDDVAELIGSDPTLIILDNCEHVIDNAAQLALELVERAHNVTLLVTSRETLDVRGESVVRIEGLSYDSIAGPAVELFLARAANVSQVEDSTHNRHLVSSITERLAGLPLAIELAVSQLNSNTLEELLVRLDDLNSALSARRGQDARQSTMSATIAWSYDLLSPPEQRTLLDFCVFTSAFTSEAAEAVAFEKHVHAMLHRLVSQSVLMRQDVDDRSRFILLEPIRQFAQNRASDEILCLAAQKHAEYFAARTKTLAAKMITDEESLAARELSIEWPDVEKSTAWGRDNQRPDISVDPLIALGFHIGWQLRSEAFRWIEEGCKALAEPVDNQADIDVVRAEGFWATQDPVQAESLLKSIVKSNGWTIDAVWLQYKQSIARSDFKQLYTDGELLWKLHCKNPTSQKTIWYAAGRLVSRVLHNAEDPEIEQLCIDLDVLIETTHWPTGLCLALYAHLIRCVVQGDTANAYRYRSELIDVASECQARYFILAAGSMTIPEKESIGPDAQLVASSRAINAAVHNQHFVQLPGSLRTAVTALAGAGELKLAAQIIGLIPHVHGMGEGSQLSPGFEQACDLVRDALSAASFEDELKKGSRLTLEQVAELIDRVLSDD